MDFYYVMHIPSGKMIKQSFRDLGDIISHMSFREKLALINRWNKDGGSTWKFWME